MRDLLDLVNSKRSRIVKVNVDVNAPSPGGFKNKVELPTSDTVILTVRPSGSLAFLKILSGSIRSSCRHQISSQRVSLASCRSIPAGRAACASALPLTVLIIRLPARIGLDSGIRSKDRTNVV
jgi:hypothetical protein